MAADWNAVHAVDVVVGRQAIFDRAGDILGYELLFRSVEGDGRTPSDIDGDLMTAELLFSSLNIGIETLVGDKLMFCNADRGLLVGEVPIALPPTQTVIEILETVRPDGEVIAGCQGLLRRGFRLALDDFSWFAGAESLLELVSIVKVDLRATPAGELEALLTRCREFGTQLLAEKVETAEEYQLCRDLGFDYFQGYFLARPRIVPGRTLEASRIRLASHLHPGHGLQATRGWEAETDSPTG